LPRGLYPPFDGDGIPARPAPRIRAWDGATLRDKPAIWLRFASHFAKGGLFCKSPEGQFNTFAANFASCGSKQTVGVAALYRLKGYNKMRTRSIKMALPRFQAKRTPVCVNKAFKNKQLKLRPESIESEKTPADDDMML
jgi:hypothetical protein